MKVEYVLNPEDYLAHLHERVQNSAGKPRSLRYVGFWVVLLFGMLAQGAALGARGVSLLIMAGVYLFIAAMFAVFRLLLPRIQKELIANAIRRGNLPTTSLSV